MNRYQYHRPESLDEAFALVAETPGAKFVAGGTDLLVQIRQDRAATPPALISLRAIPELNRIDVGMRLRIGGAVPIAEIAAHPEIVQSLPALAASIDVIGSRQIQNVATLGGNLCNASPAADTAPALLVYDARVELRRGSQVREVPLAEFFQGPGATVLRAGEILSAVIIDPPPRSLRSVFLRKGRVQMDLAVASVAVSLQIDGNLCQVARVAAGAVAPIPLRLTAAEKVLEGQSLDEAACIQAADTSRREISPITDLRSTAEYRRHLTGVLVKRALLGLLAGGGVAERGP